MKLYFSPSTCSLSPHIVLREAGLPFELVHVDSKTKQTADGRNFLDINPKGYVPVLELDNGERLTEGPAVVQYLADQVPERRLVPPNGSFERYRLQEWLNFISTEIHKSFSPLFSPATPEDFKQTIRERLLQRLAFADKTLSQHAYLMGESFSVADAYLYVVTRWGKSTNVDASGLAGVMAFMKRMGERESVKDALKAEREIAGALAKARHE